MQYSAGTPDSLPHFAQIELASAALSRGLTNAWNWSQLVQEARQLACEGHDSQSADAAARVLDSAARHAPQSTPEIAREYGLWAAAAYAATGNFPSASVAIRRTFVRLNRLDEFTARLIAAVAPTLAHQLPGELAEQVTEFLQGELAGQQLLALWPSEGAVQDLHILAFRALQQACAASTRSALAENALQLPVAFQAHLSQQVPLLLPPQLAALQSGLLSNGENALATLPPGSGKTLLGELFLVSALGEGTGLTVFLSPYVALGRQVGAALRNHLPAAYRLHILLGGSQGETELRPGLYPEVVVATPERLDALLRHQPELWEQLKAVVVDEAHLAADAQRGIKLAGLLTRLRLQQRRGGDFRMLFLSGAMQEASSLRKWAELPQENFIHSTCTPTARRLALWRQNGQMEWHGELAGMGLCHLGNARQPWPERGLCATGHYVAVEQQLPRVQANIAHLASELVENTGGPVLCLCGTRRSTRSLALALREKMPLLGHATGGRAAGMDAIEARHRHLRPLAECLKHGVAWHNATLPHEVRQHIETAVSEGEVLVVAATSTLAEGVDLPFQTTIVADWLAWGEVEGKLAQSPMSSGLFRNIAGRCGRAGAFTEGDTILFDNPLGDEQFTAPEVRSELLHSLYFSGEGSSEENNRPISTTGLEVAGNQLLAALVEGTTPEEFTRQAPDFAPEIGAVTIPGSWAQQGLITNAGSVTAKGRAIYQTDLSPGTAEKLIEVLNGLPQREYASTADIARLNAHLWRQLGEVPEAGSEIRRIFSPRSRFVVGAADLEKLGRQWLHGTPSPASFAALARHEGKPMHGLLEWVDGESEHLDPAWSADFDNFCDFQRNALETWTPWLWRAAGTLAPFCTNTFAQRVDWQEWAWRWERGVDTRWSCLALELQAPGGREAVAALGRLWPWPAMALDRFSPDPLRLGNLREESGQSAVEGVIAAALHELGGIYGAPGRNLLQLRDWLWAKAGLSK